MFLLLQVPGCIAFAALFSWTADAALRIFLGASLIVLSNLVLLILLSLDKATEGWEVGRNSLATAAVWIVGGWLLAIGWRSLVG